MAGLTRANVQDRAKAHLNVKSDTFWTAAQQNNLTDDANRHVWELIIETCPEFVVSSTSFTWPVDTESLDISGASYLNAEPYRILGVEDKPSSAATSRSNMPRPWKPMSFWERSRKMADGFRGTFWYCIQGVKMWVAPLPEATTYVTVHWIPQLAALAESTTEVLSGLAEPFGDAVACRLAWLMDCKQGGANAKIEALWREREAQIKSHAARRTMDGPRFVRYAGPYRGA